MRDEVSHLCHTVPQKVARPAGLEPATLGLEGRCSIHLSYGRVLSLCGNRECSELRPDLVLGWAASTLLFSGPPNNKLRVDAGTHAADDLSACVDIHTG